MTEGTLRLQQLYKEIAEANLQTYYKHGDELTEVSDALSSFRLSMKKFSSEESK
jgi:hypothetical protein